ncbi:MAG: glycosyl transferase [Cyanobacteria bacterium J06641_5]
MSRPILYVAITSHGFGHTVRAASVVGAAQRLNPELLPIFVCTTPHWLIRSYLPGEFIHRSRAYDVGVIQADSLRMDLPATRTEIEAIRDRQTAIIASEADYIRTNRVGLVLADIPPLAAPIAKAAGVPCWMMSNFGWDFIYRAWGEAYFDIADWVEDCYRECDALFRLPMSEPMSAFSNSRNVGVTSGYAKYTAAELRDRLGIDTPVERTILLTFGGLGLQEIPYQNLAQFPDWQFISFDRDAPELPNLCKLDGQHYRPLDVMPICDRIVSKPGYSTFAEALKTGITIVSLTRSGFAEAELLLNGIRDYAQHQIVPQEKFFKGDWGFLRAAPNPPRQTTPIATDGSEEIARAIVDFFVMR